MKVAILAGGLGTRLSEETVIRPKPMVEIGGQPILWHIMKTYAAYGFKEFVIALGYKGEYIKDYFLHFHYHSHNLTVDLKSGDVTVHDSDSEEWTGPSAGYRAWPPTRADGSNRSPNSSATSLFCSPTATASAM